METYDSGEGKRQITLNKGDQKYIFRYSAGHEDELLGALIDAANDKRTDFDWFDAAVLSLKVTQNLIQQAYEILGGYAKDESSLEDNLQL